MSLPASDNFNRADENPLGNGTWSTPTGATGCQIANNMVRSGTGTRVSYWSADTFSEDQWAQLSVAGTGTYSLGVALRVQSGAETYYRWVWDSNSLSLDRYDAGTKTVLWSKSQTLSVGDVVKAAAIGNTLECYVNGTLLQVYRDPVPIRGGAAGVAGNGSGPEGDDWSADNAVAAAITPITDAFLGAWPQSATSVSDMTFMGRMVKTRPGAAYGDVYKSYFWAPSLFSKSVTDSGSGTDALASLIASFGLSESGAGVDALANLVASLAVADSGSGVDAITSLLQFLAVTISDSGSGSDSLVAPRVSFSVSDSGSGVDGAPSISATLTVADSGSGADALSALLNLIALVESAQGTDVVFSQTTGGPYDGRLEFTLAGHRVEIFIRSRQVAGTGIRSAQAQITNPRGPRIDITME